MEQEYLIGDIFPGLYAVTTCHGNHLLKETEDKNIELYKLVRDKPQYVHKVNLDSSVDVIDYQVVELLLKHHGFDSYSCSCGEYDEDTLVSSKYFYGASVVIFTFYSPGRVEFSLDNNNNSSATALSLPVTTYNSVIKNINRFKNFWAVQ